MASRLGPKHHCIYSKICTNSDLFVDLPGYLSPSVITGDELRPDLLITLENKIIYIIELIVGYETNLLNNATRKRHKYDKNYRRIYKNYIRINQRSTK